MEWSDLSNLSPCVLNTKQAVAVYGLFTSLNLCDRLRCFVCVHMCVLHVCVCLHVYSSVCMLMCLYVCSWMSANVSIYEYLCVSLFIYVYLYLSMSLYMFVCMPMHMSISVSKCACVYIYVCVPLSPYLNLYLMSMLMCVYVCTSACM